MRLGDPAGAQIIGRQPVNRFGILGAQQKHFPEKLRPVLHRLAAHLDDDVAFRQRFLLSGVEELRKEAIDDR